MHGVKVGHIKRELAAILSPIMAAHGNRLKVDATIPGPGNQFELPVCLRLYGSEPSDGSVAQQLARFAYKPAKAALPPPVVVHTRTLDWKQQQKHLDDLFESQQKEKLSNLPDVELPRSLTSTLLEHQWTGVRWLVSREKNRDLPFWKQVSERGSTRWLCEVTNSSQPHAPTPVKGSILAYVWWRGGADRNFALHFTLNTFRSLARCLSLKRTLFSNGKVMTWVW
jgi:hypothetical protein